ncbi:unnamed protein product [Paramecium primaurelia]|uniref:Uncharacterized protein n=2 Tax=Paramecium TaxID=5884 RepID=A0A8S1U0P5_9CILI|nr:unnamed protein product [Paramecium primaurelia]CAD8158795.1 unnamed protein product [Paramecium pentaurelia]
MGALLDGNKYVHVLLLGTQDVGKTKFLYEGLLQNKYKDPPYKPTEGYNMECMKYEQTTYALWDLAASPEFMTLWHVFYQFIPFKVTIFVVRVIKGTKAQRSKHYDSIGQSRQLLHRLMTLEVFQTKPLLLIVNIEKDQSSQQGDKQDALNEAKACLNWDDIKVRDKQAIVLDVHAYLDHEQVLMAMDKMYKKAEEEDNNKKD